MAYDGGQNDARGFTRGQGSIHVTGSMVRAQVPGIGIDGKALVASAWEVAAANSSSLHTVTIITPESTIGEDRRDATLSISKAINLKRSMITRGTHEKRGYSI